MKKAILVLSIFLMNQVNAQEFFATPKDSLQTIINNANDGDVINLSKGKYKKSYNLNGKAITLRGSGKDTILRGNRFKAALTLNQNEGPNTIIENMTFKKGLRAGSINLDRAAPTIRNCFFFKNRSRGDGSAIMAFGKNSMDQSPTISNNVFYKNRTRSFKPGNIAHTIFLTNTDPLISNNTFLANDRSAIYIRGLSAPLITNNIFAYMGTIKAPERKKVDDFGEKEKRGRAIYIENLQTASDIRISYNISFANKIDDVYIQGVDFSFANLEANPVSFITTNNNLTVDPRITDLRLNRKANRIKKLSNITLAPDSPAINAGNPDPIFNDSDSSRNDIGATGGEKPFNFLSKLGK